MRGSVSCRSRSSLADSYSRPRLKEILNYITVVLRESWGMKPRSFQVFVVVFGMLACGYFAFTRRYQIEAKTWHLRHGYSTRMGDFDVPVPEHWLIYLQNSLETVLVNTAPTWHRDGKFHTAAVITVSTSPMGPNASNGMNLWLQDKRQRIEHDGVKSVEEKRVDLGNDTAVCIGGSEMRDVILRGTTKAPSTDIVSLECKSESGLNVSFVGEPSDLQPFYTWFSEIRRHK